MKYHISTKSLKKLREALPAEGIKKVADRLNISQSTVLRVLSGNSRSRSKEVVTTALSVIEDEAKEMKELESKISNL